MGIVQDVKPSKPMSLKDKLNAIQSGDNVSFDEKVVTEVEKIEESPKTTQGVPKDEAKKDITQKEDVSQDKQETQANAIQETPQETYELKINGKVYQATKDELIKIAQMNVSAQERFSEAAKLRKISETILEAAKKDPISFLQHPELGLDKKSMRESLEAYLANELLYEQMDESQKRAIDNERELAKYKQIEEQRRAEEEQKALEAEQNKYRETFEKEFVTALQKVDIPKTHQSVARMANYIQQGFKKGISVTAEEAALLVKEDLQNEFQTLLNSTPVEKIESLLGKETISKIRKHDASLVKNTIVEKTTPTISKKNEPKRLSHKEWNEYLDSFTK